MSEPIASNPEPAAGNARRRTSPAARVLLIAVAVVVVGGLVGWQVRRARAQRRAVEAIEDAGGTVRYLHQKTTGGPRGYNPRAEPWGPAWLRIWTGDEYFQEPSQVYFARRAPWIVPPGEATWDAVAALDGVETLDTQGVAINDADLARLAGLPRLKHLELLDAAVTGAGLANLKGMPALENFRIRVPPGSFGGEALATVGDLGGIRWLEIIGIDRVAPADLAPLARLGRLEKIRLTRSPEDDACLEHLRGLAGLVAIQLEQTRATDAGLARLAGLAGLEILSLGDAGVTDAGLGHLAGMARLRHLSFGDPTRRTGGRITDAGLARVGRLGSITRLALAGEAITDAGLDALGGLALVGLQLSGLEATEAGLVRLLRGRQFATLGLSGPGVTDAWLPHLAGQAGKLRWLSLGRSRVTDEGVDHLASLGRLEVLSLAGTEVTNAGVHRLAASSRSLRHLDVRGTHVSASGLMFLKMMWPGLVVVSDLSDPEG